MPRLPEPPSTERFLDLATRPLADNAELHLAAHAELRAQLEIHAADSPHALAAAADSLARADRHPRRKHWRTALYLTTLLVFLPALGHAVWQYCFLRQFIHPFFLFSQPRPTHPLGTSGHARKLTSRQHMILFGNPRANNESDHWRPLWDGEPNNRACLAQYASAYFQDHKQLSPEILAAAERLDPDNGWFPVLAAAGLADGAAEKKRLSPAEAKEGKTPVWIIHHEENLQQALAELHRAAAMPRFTSYHMELLRQRVPLLPPPTDIVSGISLWDYISWQDETTFRFLPLVQPLSAGTQMCAARNDVAGFRRIVHDWQWLASSIVNDRIWLIDTQLARAIVDAPLADFRDAARSLGLDAEASRFEVLKETLWAEKEARNQGLHLQPVVALAETRGSLLASMAVPAMARAAHCPPGLSASDLAPGRYADHALFDRLAAIASWAGLGLCAGFAALHRFRHGPLVRALSARLLDLLHPSDWIWLLVGGVVAPFLWHLAITRLTPLGTREWTLNYTGFVSTAGQSASLLVMMVILPVLMARWRLAKRASLLGLTTRMPWPGWSASAAAVAALPVYGAMSTDAGPASQHFAVIGEVLIGSAILWLMVGFSRSVFGWRHHALRRAVLARILLPAWFCGMLVFALAIPAHYAEERHWSQQDHILEMSPDMPGVTRYEWQVTQVVRKELLETMESW